MSYNSTVLSQLLKIFPRLEFERLAKKHDGKRRSDAFSRWSQFVALSTAQLCGRHSLRDIETTIESQPSLKYHLATQNIKRTTLARANEKLDYEFYSDVFSSLYQRCLNRTPNHKFKFKDKLFSLDGSLIDLSMKIFPWADYNRQKSAVKLHVGLDHEGLIPAFVSLTGSKESEMEQASNWDFPSGSVLVFDKGYNSYAWHDDLTDKGYSWVTRIRSNAQYKTIRCLTLPKNSQVISDEIIKYTSRHRKKGNLRPIRMVTYIDKLTNKEYRFITNQFKWSAQTIANIYKDRWQVELFFKWMKQNLKIKSFFGNSENAVMTQIMVALCMYLLMAYLKFEAKVTMSIQKIIRLIQTNLFMRRSLLELLLPIKPKAPPDRQMNFALVLN